MAEPFPREGLPLPEARARVLAAISPLQGMERLPLAACLGRVSAEPCHAREAVPGFRASIMDGYAIADASPPSTGAQWGLVGGVCAGVRVALHVDTSWSLADSACVCWGGDGGRASDAVELFVHGSKHGFFIYRRLILVGDVSVQQLW